MAQVIVTESSLENIAGAIRAKLGTQATYKPAQMAGAIAQIHGDPVLEALNVNANGTYTPSSGKDGFSQAVVNVPNSYSSGDEGKVVSGGALVAQSSQTITDNGTYDTTLKNQVTVNVSGGGSVLVPKTITQNGTYNPASDNADGYSQVVVNVSGGGNITKIMNQGQVSTTSAYATANFDSGVDLSEYDVLYFELYRNGAKIGTNSFPIPTSYPYNFTIAGGSLNYRMRLTLTSIACTQYSGDYVDLFVDVYGIKI